MVELRVLSRGTNKVRVAKHPATEVIKNRASRRHQKDASSLPRWIPPQLCQLVETAPSGPQWLHEIKLDGFRMSARIDRGRVQLLTRTGLDWSDKCPSVVEALAKVRAKTAYLDGELCGIGDDGLPTFSRTQTASDGSRGFALSISFSISYIATAATSRACLERGEWSDEFAVVDDGGVNKVLIWSCDESAPRHPPLFFALAEPAAACRRLSSGIITFPNPV